MRMLTLLACLLLTVSLRAVGGNYVSLTAEDGLSSGTVWAIIRDSKGFMFIGTETGVDRYDGTKVVSILFPDDGKERPGHVTFLKEKDDGQLIVGTDVGPWTLDKRELKLTRLPAGTKVRQSPHSAVYTGWGRYSSANVVYDDPFGMQWVGYKFFGMDYQPYSRKLFHLVPNPSSDVRVRSFCRDGNRLLLGTRSGLVVIDGDKESFVGPEVLGGEVVSQISRLGDYYLVGTLNGGVSVLDSRTLQVRSRFLSRANIYDIELDGRGNGWVASSAGLLCVSGHNLATRLFTASTSQLPSNEVLSVTFDRRGRGWVTTLRGMAVYDSDKKVIFFNALPQSLQQLSALRTIVPYGKGHLALVPIQGMPLDFDESTGRLTKFQFNIYEQTPSFQSLVPLDSGFWLFTTEHGLYIARQGGAVRKFGYIDGLPDLEFQSHALEISPKGELWAATNGGLIHASLSEMRHFSRRHVSIVLNEIQTDHWFDDGEVNSVAYDGVLRLNRHSNDATIKFSPLIYGNTRDLTFRYRLVGHGDSTWQTTMHNRVICLRNLFPGSYRLDVEAIGMPEISLSLTVDVPVTNMALMLAFFVFIAGALTIHIVYCKHYRKPYLWERFQPRPQKYQKSLIDSKESSRLLKLLTDYMQREKPYLDPGLQMSDIAKAIGCSTHSLSQLFSQNLQRSYYDFVAEYRVNEFKRLAQEPDYANYTITALSEMCGFRSRNTFSMAFKKFTGMTPKEYMKSIGK